MADLYPSSSSSSFHTPRFHANSDPLPPFQHNSRHAHSSHFYNPSNASPQSLYSNQLLPPSHHSSSSSASPEDTHEPSSGLYSPSRSSVDQHHNTQSPNSKQDVKPQATFLTKLYNLLERPENHHMIRWDPAGEHIIVERPEQLAMHVLPSIYRQSRFASFSRQLNIYGFMRKVNLRNVDPAIDDPDASTWSHPTLNRHSPPEVVANFKRRVPPRLPKPRKREPQDSIIPQPRSAIANPNGLLPLPPNSNLNQKNQVGRARGFSAPGSFSPMANGNASWSGNYGRNPLPPLTVPEPPMSQTNMYNSSSHALHPITPTDSPSSAHFSHNPLPHYSNSSNRDVIMGSANNYPYSDHHNWQSTQHQGHSSGSLSSLLNPSSGQSRPTPTINTSYTSSLSSLPLHAEHSASSLSPDSRPTTSYSSSVSSLPYEEHSHYQDYSRPNSSHHRSSSPPRPQSKNGYSSIAVRRNRRHSQAVNPYPNMYDQDQTRPSTSPSIDEDNQPAGIPRVRSMIQLPSVDQYHFNGAQSEFAYSAIPGPGAMDVSNGSGWNHRPIRPSTSTSSISAASHASSSQAATPDSYGTAGETNIHRFSPDYGYVPMNEHLPPAYSKPVGEL